MISDSCINNGSNAGVAGAQIAGGDLPGPGNPNGFLNAVTVVNDATGTDEGRAMLEIIHDVALGAQLFFHSAFNNPGNASQPPDQTIANAINALAAQNVDIIVDDVGILTASRSAAAPATAPPCASPTSTRPTKTSFRRSANSVCSRRAAATSRRWTSSHPKTRPPPR